MISRMSSLKDGFLVRIGVNPYELSSEDYYSKFLTEKDSTHLRDFVERFGAMLAEELPSAIVAVGSSTFPKYYWGNQMKTNLRNFKRVSSVREFDKSPDVYGDIDLLVVPEESTNFGFLVEDLITDRLKRMDFDYKTKSFPTGYHDDTSRWSHVDYPSKSIETRLPNGTKLDLIHDRRDLTISAEFKIEDERGRMNAFSVLRRGTLPS